MNYLLAVLTHGEAPTLDRCLASFFERVTPAPCLMIVHRDGPGETGPLPNTLPFLFDASPEQRGFCEATRYLWSAAAAASDADYVFYLEHDFVFTRDVDLRELAAVLDANPTITQMQLMRQAVNEQEKAAGGLYESRPGQYERKTRYAYDDDLDAGDELGPLRGTYPWLEHTAYMTTNPCLMRRDFMVRNPWPAYPSECEGRFGIDLVAHGYSFGVWGDGQPWVEHVGVRDGFGY